MFTALQINSWFYSRNILRFIAFVALGCYLKKLKQLSIQQYIVFLMAAVIGVGYIILTLYVDGYTPVIFTYCKMYALPVIGWVGLVLYLLLKEFESYSPKCEKLVYFTSIIGKASYHILCVQMIWFDVVGGIRKVLPIDTSTTWVILSFTFSVSFGIIFYYVEPIITKNIINKMNPRKNI